MTLRTPLSRNPRNRGSSPSRPGLGGLNPPIFPKKDRFRRYFSGKSAYFSKKWHFSWFRTSRPPPPRPPPPRPSSRHPPDLDLAGLERRAGRRRAGRRRAGGKGRADLRSRPQVPRGPPGETWDSRDSGFPESWEIQDFPEIQDFLEIPDFLENPGFPGNLLKSGFSGFSQIWTNSPSRVQYPSGIPKTRGFKGVPQNPSCVGLP